LGRRCGFAASANNNQATPALEARDKLSLETMMPLDPKKQYERDTLDALLSVLGLPADTPCQHDDKPEFIIEINGRTVGIEVTSYQSGQLVVGKRRREIEAEWEKFDYSSKRFREENSELKDISIIFRFKDLVPSSKERKSFLVEILTFVRAHRRELGPKYSIFSTHQFTSQFMSRYLTDLCLCVSDSAYWDSNVTAGFLGPFVQNLAQIVRRKSKKAKDYRETTELWLVIRCGGRISETGLPMNGADDFNRSGALRASLKACSFSKVYVATAMGWFCWQKLHDWKQCKRSASG
jgi:hypothetical protein